MTDKRHFCAYCGDDMGPWDRFSSREDTCGKRECALWARDQERADREEAHEHLDNERGWL